MTRSEAAQVAAVVVGVLAALILTGPAGMTLALFAAGLAFLVRAELRRHPPGTGGDNTSRPETQGPCLTTTAPLPAELPVEHLLDEQLCWAWRTSYAQLQRNPDTTSTAAIAGRRHTYLDEIARRYPPGFAEWMASGARAGSDPTRFLRPRAAPQPRSTGSPQPAP